MNALDLTKHFARTYQEKYGHPYPVAYSKHPSMFKRLLSIYSDTDLKDLITRYLTEFKNPFAEKAGHSIEVFVTTLPALLASEKKSEDVKPTVNPDYLRLENARKSKVAGGGDESDF